MHDSESVEHFGEKTADGDNEHFRVAVDKIPNAITKIAFTVTIHEAQKRRQNCGQISNTFIRVVNETDGKEILRYDLGEDFSTETAVVVAEIYRNKGEWKFKSVGAGFSGGLAALCKNFGIDVS